MKTWIYGFGLLLPFPGQAATNEIPQVEVEVRFVETEQKVLNELGLEWLLTEPLTNAPANPEKRVEIRSGGFFPGILKAVRTELEKQPPTFRKVVIWDGQSICVYLPPEDVHGKRASMAFVTARILDPKGVQVVEP